MRYECDGEAGLHIPLIFPKTFGIYRIRPLAITKSCVIYTDHGFCNCKQGNHSDAYGWVAKVFAKQIRGTK